MRPRLRLETRRRRCDFCGRLVVVHQIDDFRLRAQDVSSAAPQARSCRMFEARTTLAGGGAASALGARGAPPLGFPKNFLRSTAGRRSLAQERTLAALARRAVCPCFGAASRSAPSLHPRPGSAQQLLTARSREAHSRMGGARPRARATALSIRLDRLGGKARERGPRAGRTSHAWASLALVAQGGRAVQPPWRRRTLARPSA